MIEAIIAIGIGIVLLLIIMGVVYLPTYKYPYTLEEALHRAKRINSTHANIEAYVTPTWYGHIVRIKAK